MEDHQPLTPEQSSRSGQGRVEAGPTLENCQEAIATLYSFLDGELTTDRRQQIQRHLDECAPCFQAFDFEADLKALIARKCRDEVPGSLRDKVVEALRAEDVPS
ncbi:MAG: mycothiol system anti-sigma-R factor [Acidimicrobiales bacterium]